MIIKGEYTIQVYSLNFLKHHKESLNKKVNKDYYKKGVSYCKTSKMGLKVFSSGAHGGYNRKQQIKDNDKYAWRRNTLYLW